MSSITIRTYDPQGDESLVYALWERTLGRQWPLSQDSFHHKTVESGVYESGDHFVAERDSALIGFVGTQTRTIPGESIPQGEIMVVLVDPTCRRQGVGRSLLDQALSALRRRGVRQAQLGAGGVSYFWAGVPTNLPDAWAFFEACGWPRVEASFDLVRDLKDYATPPAIYERIRLPGLTLGTATAADRGAVLAFEAQHFPKWLIYYQAVMQQGDPADVIVARDGAGKIVGTTYALHPGQEWQRGDFVWERRLGKNTGGIGPLGVAESARENGIGLALAARVTERLQAYGVAKSYVGYTWLVDWYGKLGYRVWQEYQMSWRPL